MWALKWGNTFTGKSENIQRREIRPLPSRAGSKIKRRNRHKAPHTTAGIERPVNKVPVVTVIFTAVNSSCEGGQFPTRSCADSAPGLWRTLSTGRAGSGLVKDPCSPRPRPDHLGGFLSFTLKHRLGKPPQIFYSSFHVKSCGI